MSTVRIQVRRGTEAQWALVNPILAAGEVGLESDTNYFKFGTGSTAWNALPYANEPLSDLENRVGAYLEDELLGQPNGVASLNSSGKVPAAQLDITELSQDAVNTAITAGTGVTKAYDDDNNTITISADTSVLATKMYAESYADQKVADIVNLAPGALDTLAELADALGNDADYAATITTQLGFKAPLSAPTFTGSVTLPSTTTIGSVSDAAIAHLENVTSDIQAQIDDKAPIASPTLTGTVTLPSTTSIGYISATEIGYLSGIGSSVQLQINAKAPIDAPTFTGNVSLPSTTNIGDVTNNEIAYLEGVTSSVQLQLDDKAPIESPTFTGTVSGVTKAMIGLGNVDDTSDLDKSISTATQTALDAKADAGDLTSHESATTTVHGIADTAALATKDYADAAVSTHDLDTTNVHGIANTALLATTANVATAKSEAIDAAAVASENYADSLATNYDAAGTAASEVSTHSGVTTSVHGIADTSKLVTTDAVSTTLDGSLTVEGDLTVNGTNFAASATSITIEDNMVQLAHQNAANTVDLGLVVGYNDGTAKHSGIVRDVSDAKWKLFKGVTTEPSTTVDFTQGSLDDLALNNLTAAGVVFADGTQTKQGVPSQTAIVAKSAAFNITDADYRDSMIEVDHTGGSAVTITVTADGTNGITYPVGTSFDILRTNTGAVTIAGSGATINATPGLTLRARWSSATLFKRAANTWVLMGDLTA